MYATEKENKGGLSERKVIYLVIAKFGVSSTARNIQRYIKDGIIGQSPLEKGRVDDFSPFVFIYKNKSNQQSRRIKSPFKVGKYG